MTTPNDTNITVTDNSTYPNAYSVDLSYSILEALVAYVNPSILVVGCTDELEIVKTIVLIERCRLNSIENPVTKIRRFQDHNANIHIWKV